MLSLRLFTVAVHCWNFFSSWPTDFAGFHGGTETVHGDNHDNCQEQSGQTGIDLVVEDDCDISPMSLAGARTSPEAKASRYLPA